MDLTAEQVLLTPAQAARLNQERSRRPSIATLEDYVAMKSQGMAPDAIYDHVNDMVYVRLLDENGEPSDMWRHEAAIDPNPNNRNYRTVEDPK